MTTALDVVKGALRRLTSYQSGEPVAGVDQQDCLDTLNDLLDSWSIQKLNVPGSLESILSWTPGRNQYRIGNPSNASLGLPNFTGTVTGGSAVITGVTNIPSGLLAGTSALNASSLTDTGNVFPAGAYVTAIGANTVTMNAVATATPATNPDSISYTIPGDFGIPRPLRITGGFTRFNGLDFTLDVFASQAEYTGLLYKAQPGPWPVIAWYNNQSPYGILNVYQTPGNAAELHLFTDVILPTLTATTVIQFPQGYARALKWCLARELWVEYVSPVAVPTMLEKMAGESLAAIQALNAVPAERSKYDRALTRGNRADGGWITHGGYR
jgi:hypothetical protein